MLSGSPSSPGDRRTQVFFESGRRLASTLAELAVSHSQHRPTVVCRELTKTHRGDQRGPLAEWPSGRPWVSEADPQETPQGKKKSSGAVRGEITLVVAGAARRSRRRVPASGGSDVGGLP